MLQTTTEPLRRSVELARTRRRREEHEREEEALSSTVHVMSPKVETLLRFVTEHAPLYDVDNQV